MTGHHAHSALLLTAALAIAVLVPAAVCYLAALRRTRQLGRAWPATRTLLWFCGLTAAATALIVPAHGDFRIHMVGHVLLGMLAPLLIVLSAPVTLALRTLPVHRARLLSAALRAGPVRLVTSPMVTATLSIGGLWLLYHTDLYAVSTQQPVVHVLVHAHVFLAGTVLAFSLVGRDPAPHRAPLPVRAAVAVLAVAAHNTLSKSLYREPPRGVLSEQAEVAAQIMYYGGAPLEIAIFVLLGAEWARSERRTRLSREEKDPTPPFVSTPARERDGGRL